MVAALPMQDRMDDCTVPAHDDLRECRAKDTLARCGGCSWMGPGALQISTERHQLLALRPAERRRTTRNQGGDLSFKLCDSLQCLVPAAFQLTGDQPVCRVDGVTGNQEVAHRLIHIARSDDTKTPSFKPSARGCLVGKSRKNFLLRKADPAAN